ncbi:MAG: hypothetical protein A2X82_02705 [Geobacteraceae bacterium GWC2_55_20]|nr:MAG: hypothetical protein A2X82_02705 [Geobacteraceae bacterium GWC2_55_20]OGU19888.1 MAG: hypothetical protein A2X85_01540 [Geobacteraceae bacterium GWF2_54_21]
MRKTNEALKYGTTITLWADNLVYAFLFISGDDVALTIINKGYERMPVPLLVGLNPDQVPQRFLTMVANELEHWQTRLPLQVDNGQALLTVDGKTIDIYCRNV